MRSPQHEARDHILMASCTQVTGLDFPGPSRMFQRAQAESRLCRSPRLVREMVDSCEPTTDGLHIKVIYNRQRMCYMNVVCNRHSRSTKCRWASPDAGRASRITRDKFRTRMLKSLVNTGVCVCRIANGLPASECIRNMRLTRMSFGTDRYVSDPLSAPKDIHVGDPLSVRN